MLSVWSDNSNSLKFETLNKSLKTDVLIIGGGITGILCAYYLKKAGVNYALVESGRICDKTTKNTTAKITSQHGLIYDKLICEFGVEMARLYFNANQEALEEYRRLCEKIDCDFETKDAFVYSTKNRSKIEKEIIALGKIGFKANFLESLPIPVSIAGAVRFRNQAEFNPLKFIYSIANGLNIYENTTVRELFGTTAITSGGEIFAKKIIVATHFPFINKHGSYFLKMYQHRSYVIALENAKEYNGMYVDESDSGLSFRNYKNLLLLGGKGHRTGKKAGGWDELRNFAKINYPNATEKYHWATQDCMSLDGVPYIGNYSASTPNLYVATGYNKWGMTSSMVAANLLVDLITGKSNPYTNVFSPSRTILRPQLAVNASEAVANLLSVRKKRCPHLGCALKWNSQERSWDCPCHGSRFSESGELIDNPATGDLKK